jgi:AcrR family transcriptional regulator
VKHEPRNPVRIHSTSEMPTIAIEQVRVRRRQKDRTALSERRLMEAAISLLIEHGVERTTLAAIGERSGYSRGMVTHRFGSKSGLFAYVHDAVAHDWIERVQASVGDAVGIDALNRVVDVLQALLEESPDALRAMYLLRYASIDPGALYRANVAKVHAAQRRDAHKWITEGQSTGSIHSRLDASLAAELFCAAVDGLLYRWLVTPEIPIKRLHRMLKQYVRKLAS